MPQPPRRVEGSLPPPEGRKPARPVAKEVGESVHAGRFRASATLLELSAEFAFFNHGALYTVAQMDADPLVDYVLHSGMADDDRPFFVDFDRTILAGIGVGGPRGKFISWDNRLYAVPRRAWGPLKAHLSGIAGLDLLSRTLMLATAVDFDIVDPAAMARLTSLPGTLPTVPITAFDVSGNRYRCLFGPGLRPLDPPRMVRLPPHPDDVAKADRVLPPLLGPK